MIKYWITNFSDLSNVMIKTSSFNYLYNVHNFYRMVLVGQFLLAFYSSILKNHNVAKPMDTLIFS